VERNKQSQFLKIKAAGKMAAFLLQIPYYGRNSAVHFWTGIYPNKKCLYIEA